MKTFYQSFLCILACSVVVHAQGYRIDDNEVIIETARHWKSWTYPSHLVEIKDAGAIQPRLLRQVFDVLSDQNFGRPVEITNKKPRINNIDSTQKLDVLGNPVKDAQDNFVFNYVVRPGVSRAGSNLHLGKNIFDGDPSTFWQPDPNDPIENWWIELDLGRLVPIERLQLDFVNENLGDPFLKFILLISREQVLGLGDDSKIGFEVFVPQDGPNISQRTFIFDSKEFSGQLPTDPRASESKQLLQTNADPEWTGKLVETIRIVVSDSRFGRAELISQQTWEALIPAERGDVVYYVRDFAGREEPVAAATYATLTPERQGRKDYYRRELPRLASVKVFGWGDNIGSGINSGGGSFDLNISGRNAAAAFDGNVNTYYQHNAQDPLVPDANVLKVDIGGTIWLDQIRLIGSNIRGYVMRSSEGGKDAQGNLRWRTISSRERENNVDEGFYSNLNDIQQPTRKVRFFDLITLANFTGDTENRSDRFWPYFHEFMLFSEGAPAGIELTSDLIELPGLVTLGKVNWEADMPSGTEVEIRTRTGDQLLQQIRYFHASGIEQTPAQYKRLLGFLKGPIDTTVTPGTGWSAWSQKLLKSGELATSPSLKQFMQIQARLISNDRQSIASLNRIEVQLHTPVTQRLQAEIWPVETQVGKLDTFEVFIQPSFIERPVSIRSLGFDEIRLRTTPPLNMQILDLALGTEQQLSNDTPRRLYSTPINKTLEDSNGESIQLLQDQEDFVWIKLPTPLQAASANDQEFYRLVNDGDEVPTSLDGQILTQSAYNRLADKEKGSKLYFKQVQIGTAEKLEEITQSEYEDLEDPAQGIVRYFRLIEGLGGQSKFDTAGFAITAQDYNALGSSKGWTVGQGELIRVRFVASVFLHGTRLNVAVRNASRAVATPWQEANAGEATKVRPASTLSIGALGADDIVDAVTLSPNPFTPNEDGINDAVNIKFSLFKIYNERQIHIHIYSLDGNLVRTLDIAALGGLQQVSWDGRDTTGNLVTPGLYMCQINAAADDGDAAGQKKVHLIGVAY